MQMHQGRLYLQHCQRSCQPLRDQCCQCWDDVAWQLVMAQGDSDQHDVALHRPGRVIELPKGELMSGAWSYLEAMEAMKRKER